MTPDAHRAARAKFIAVWPTVAGLPEMTIPRLQLAQSVTAFESSYGSPAAWDQNSPAMRNSHNWGAITCPTCGAPDCAEAHDTTQTGGKYTACFRVYPDDAAGIRGFLSLFTHGEKLAALTRAASIHDFAQGMYRDHYFAGRCPEAVKTYGTSASSESSFYNAAGATSDAGRACDAETVNLYTGKLAELVQEIAAAMGEQPIARGDELGAPTIAGLPQWVVLLGAISAAAALGWWLLGDRQRSHLVRELLGRKNPRRLRENPENPSASEWRIVRSGICGKERDERRRRARSAIEALEENVRGQRRVLRTEADRPCVETLAEMSRRAREERAERAERAEKRTPTQRKTSARNIERYHERVDREASNVEGEHGTLAAAYFRSHAKRYFAAARGRNKHPYEVFSEELESDSEPFEEWKMKHTAKELRRIEREEHEAEADYEDAAGSDDGDEGGDETAEPPF